MKAAIIGSNGQLGLDCLQVFGADHAIYGADLPLVDLSDGASCHAFLNEVNPDVVINCAAYTAVDTCESDPVCWTVNADGPGHLAEWVERHRRHLIHISTDYVFSGTKPLFQSIIETEPTEPVSEYGRSKLAGELAIASKTDRFSILRTAWLYGANGRNFLKTMLRLALKNPAGPLKVVNDQFGSPTWSHTLARQIQAVVEQEAHGVYHATSEGYCSWFDLASVFLDAMSVPHEVVPCSTSEYPTPAQRPINSILENARLKALDLNLFQDWQTELEQFVKRHGYDLKHEIEGSL